jgi:CBS domain-containing protein
VSRLPRAQDPPRRISAPRVNGLFLYLPAGVGSATSEVLLIIGRNAGCLPVVDAGRVVGIVTAADLMRVVRAKADTGAPTAHGVM